MTLMKEKAVEMIRRMPEDNMTYVINILQNLEAMSIDRNEDKKRARNALAETKIKKEPKMRLRKS